MTRLPRISGRECVRVLESIGFSQVHRKGSHMVMRRDSPYARTTVPDHKELNTGTLRNIIRQAGLDVPTFVRLMRS